jgi:hypothetical protein
MGVFEHCWSKIWHSIPDRALGDDSGLRGIECPKNRGSQRMGVDRKARFRREKDDPKKDGRKKEGVPDPLRFWSLPWARLFCTAHCRNVPVLPRGSASKDQLGMRQGAEGGPCRVCARISTPGPARGHEGKEPAVRSFKFAGPFRGRSLSGTKV